MSELLEIAGVEEREADLLEAVGVLGFLDLAKFDEGGLHEEMVKANEMLELVEQIPHSGELSRWIRQARDRCEGDFVEDEVVVLEQEIQEEVRIDENEKKIEELSQDEVAELPVAYVLPAMAMKKAGLRVSDIPIGLVESRRPPEERARVESERKRVQVLHRETQKKEDAVPLSQSSAVEGISLARAEKPPVKEEIAAVDFSRVQSIDDVIQGAQRRVEPLARRSSNRITSVSKGLNKGISSKSRRYIRGVLHLLPGRVFLGAFLILMIPLVIAAGFVSLSLVFFDVLPKEQSWWFIAGFFAMLLVALAFQLVASRAKCQVCGMKQFVPKNTRKNVKAHRLLGLGYIIPTALHVLFFKWFRCIFCGTPIRLKE